MGTSPPPTPGPRLWIALDPALPTTEQLASISVWATEHLAAARRASPPPVTPRIPAPARIIEALQALDATETGASIATIADQLVLTEAERFRGVTGRKRSAARARAARAIKRAHWLIETGYRFIAMREIYEISRHD